MLSNALSPSSRPALAAILDQGISGHRARAHTSLAKAARRALATILSEGILGRRVPAGFVWLLGQSLPSPHACLLMLSLMFA